MPVFAKVVGVKEKKNMNKPTCFLIVGRSGSGKTTIVNEVCRRTGLIQLQSYTTRPPRHDGEGGHVFITKEEASKLKNVVAETNFAGNYYAATREQVDDSDFYVIDKIGLSRLRRSYQGKRTIKVVYIRVTPEKAERNMLNRGDEPKRVKGRLLHDQDAFDGIEDDVDFILDNEKTLDEAISTMLDYVLQSTKG